ncbi:hypothetical protein B0H21DRAFT_499573 [Amylocystis lapponica]|nr:hypothetical protein B0H21DRAFT_499573 [Amylocystis lapponica]
MSLLSASITPLSRSHGGPVYQAPSPQISPRYQESSLVASCGLCTSSLVVRLDNALPHYALSVKHTTSRSLKRTPTMRVIMSSSSRTACTGASPDVTGPPTLRRVRVVCAVQPFQFHDILTSVPRVTQPPTHTASQIPGLISLSNPRAQGSITTHSVQVKVLGVLESRCSVEDVELVPGPSVPLPSRDSRLSGGCKCPVTGDVFGSSSLLTDGVYSGEVEGRQAGRSISPYRVHRSLEPPSVPPTPKIRLFLKIRCTRRRRHTQSGRHQSNTDVQESGKVL